MEVKGLYYILVYKYFFLHWPKIITLHHNMKHWQCLHSGEESFLNERTPIKIKKLRAKNDSPNLHPVINIITEDNQNNSQWGFYSYGSKVKPNKAIKNQWGIFYCTERITHIRVLVSPASVFNKSHVHKVSTIGFISTGLYTGLYRSSIYWP